MAAYLTADQAIDRLIDRFGIDADAAAVVSEGDVDAASDYLDHHAPFNGTRPEDQERQFPREDDAGELQAIPAAVLDWVALRAYQISADVEPAVKSESAGRVSVTYENPKDSQTSRRMANLLAPHLSSKGYMGYGKGVTRYYPIPQSQL
jgi:hypothetical protein